MAGTVVTYHDKQAEIKKLTYDWLSDASGDATDTTAIKIVGTILRVVFTPDSGGTQPTNLYDVTLTDDNSEDVLQGLGANLSNATATDVCPHVNDGTYGQPTVVNDFLDLAVANAGNAKGGTIAIYYK